MLELAGVNSYVLRFYCNSDSNKGRPKALQTSSRPGQTRAISTRLKLSEDPKVYCFDTPGVMVPFLGKGEYGIERGIKLALIGKIGRFNELYN